MAVAVFASAETDSRTRGRSLGSSWAGDIAAGWAGYQHLFDAYGIAPEIVRDIGARSLDAVADWSPAHAEEIAGIADGAALEPWEVGGLNARTEILARYRPATVGECSMSVYLPPGAPPRTIQTWDWYDHLREVKLIWQLRPTPERTVKTFTEFGVLGKIGVNDAGVGVHFNLLQHDADGEGVGVPVHIVARRILDEACDLDDAEQIVRSATVSASTAITVTAWDGARSAARTFELSPRGVGRRSAEDGGHLVHTNHFLDPELATGERLGPVDPDTFARQRELEARRESLRAADIGDRAAALLLHRENGAALCCHPEPDAPFGARWETLLVVGLDVEHARIVCRDGAVCGADSEAWLRV